MEGSFWEMQSVVYVFWSCNNFPLCTYLDFTVVLSIVKYMCINRTGFHLPTLAGGLLAKRLLDSMEVAEQIHPLQPRPFVNSMMTWAR